MEKLLDIVARLRHPENGCPWDLQQTLSTIVPHTLEEIYELIEAIEEGNSTAVKDELGDVLFQVLLLSRIAEDEQLFTLNDVVVNLCEKLVRRHPHVFTNQKFGSASEHAMVWEEIKREERRVKQQAEVADQSVLEGVSIALPALVRAPKLQRRAAAVGFDWDNIESVFAKVEEEIAELKAELATSGSKQRIEAEMGDILLACSNLARHLEVDAEVALRKANLRFETRFRYIETQLLAQGKEMNDVDLKGLEALWQSAKQQEE